MTDNLEERLVAHVDNELDAAGRAGVEAAAAADPAVAARIAAHRTLRRHLSGVFGGVIDAPVPQGLIDTVLAEPQKPSAVVLPFTPRSRLAARSLGGGWWAQVAAMAACLVAGIALTMAAVGNRGDVTTRDGSLVAHGA